MPAKLKDRVAVVTGSGQGIGRAIALALAKEGAKNNRRPSTPGGDAETTAEQITETGGQAIPFFGDIASFDIAEKLIRTAEEIVIADLNLQSLKNLPFAVVDSLKDRMPQLYKCLVQ